MTINDQPDLDAIEAKAAELRARLDKKNQWPSDNESYWMTEGWKNGTRNALDELHPEELVDEVRRLRTELAASNSEAHPAMHRWMAEIYDPAADEWVPGTRHLLRLNAVKQLNHAKAIGPTWKDGTPVERRLVRETTTYTVESPDADPARSAAV